MAPYIIVGVIAAAPLLFLSAAAPGGGSWRWLEYPRSVTVIAFALGMFACSRKGRTSALLAPIGTVVLATIWAVAMARSASRGLVFISSMKQLAPWLVGSLYGALALLSIARAAAPRSNRLRAGLWLCATGVIAIVLTMQNESWLTLENFDSSNTTYRSTGGWPDTKQISMAVACCASALGAAIAAYALRKPASLLPRAIVR